MKKRIFLIGFLFLIIFTQVVFAKYTLSDNTILEVYIDKTPPVINLVGKDKNETFTTSNLTDVVKNNSEVTINTSDNIQIEKNEYYYNPLENNFNDIPSNPFDSGKEFNEDGYYKITTIDTSGNKTEIIILIDKTAPEVEVKFYKKGEKVAKLNTTEVKQVATIKKNLSSEKIIDSTNETNSIDEVSKSYETKSLLAARAGSINVSNEAELRNAINNKYSDIITWGSIAISSPLYINHSVKIHPATNENALQFTGYGNFIVVQSSGVLDLTAMVIYTNGITANRGVTAINIESGAKVIFNENSIVDGGKGNTGILVNSGATLLMNSCHIANSNKGVIVSGNGTLSFANLQNGRNSEFWGNNIAISFENFTGTCNFNQSNIKIKDNSSGIITNSSAGTINISNIELYNNSVQGIASGNVKLNMTGGTIRNNGIGVYLYSGYNGNFSMSGGSIHSNTQYAINHSQNADSSCNIYGGNISGKIFLGQDDNYVNTTDKYPRFEVTPSKYYFKRKLVKTSNNNCANTEISKVTLTANGNWYKYVDEEYIVVWKGCNVKTNYTDYYGNIIATETMNGNLGDPYETLPKELEGYDLIEVPENQKGNFTESDIVVTYKYDLKNIAIVKYEDLLSGVQSAKVWYNAVSEDFTGEGTDFENNQKFEDYGYYKVEVTNGVGLKKELTFTLNKDSLIR